MKILITGGCGFLGSNLAHSFIESEAKVFIIDSLVRYGSEKNLDWLRSKAKDGKLVFAKDDITNYKQVISFFKKHGPFDFVCHVAGQVAMNVSIKNPRNDLEINILGTFNILEAVREYSPEALIAYSSTNKVYGDLKYLELIEEKTRYNLKNYLNGLDESLQLDFSTPYGCSKGAADQYVRDWSRVYDLKTVVFRHSSIYGLRQFASINQGWVGWFCEKALEQKKAYSNKITPEPFTISGTGKQVRDLLHAEDLISLYHAAYENKNKLKGEIFNIGGGIKNSLSLLELFEILKNELSLKELVYKKIKRRTSDQDYFVANIDKAKNLLGWSPNISHEEGIRKMIEWSQSIFC